MTELFREMHWESYYVTSWICFIDFGAFGSLHEEKVFLNGYHPRHGLIVVCSKYVALL